MGWQDRDYNRDDKGGSWAGLGGGSGGGRGGGFAGGDFLGALRRFFNKSFDVGTYLDVRVRVHITFLLFVGLECLFTCETMREVFWTLRWSSLLFLSVLLHEFGHCLACRRVGGMAHDILMWPLGGLAFCLPPQRPWPQFVTVVWGPLVNVILAGACYSVLLTWSAAAGAEMPVSLNPLAMWAGYADGVRGLLADLFVVNYALLLFNLCLVFYPFDGGRIVQIALWKRYGFGRSMRIACDVGMGGAVLVALYGLAVHEMLLIIIAIFGFMTCYQQKSFMRAQGAFGAAYGAGAVYGGGESWSPAPKPPRPGPIARWRAARTARKNAARRRQREHLEAEVDRILAKVKEHGLQSLTPKERKTLEHATESSRRDG